jgi:DNA invertase Pin-like site-specific DNA recombinase
MYCLYCRVSTKRQGDSGLGLQAQRDIVRHFYPDIHREFVEVRSGKNVQDRPILAEAIEYCLKHDMVLVVAKVDRLTRSTKDGLSIMERLKGRIRFCDLPGEPDKFMLTLFFAFAERERELISIRTKGALKSAKERGRSLGVSAPKGRRVPWLEEYRELARKVRTDDSKRNADNIRARNYAKELHNNGSKIRIIVQRLNDGGFGTPSGRGKWSLGSVHRLLKE